MIELNAEEIDRSGTHLFWEREDDILFLSSVREIGQLEPVLVTREKDAYILVAGLRRVKAQAFLGRKVRAQEAGELTDMEKGLVYLHSNLGQSLTQAMQVRALRFFAVHMNKSELEERILPNMGVPTRSRLAGQLMSWLDLPQEWDRVLEHEHLPLAAIDVLTSFSSDELKDLFPFFTGLKWSRSNAVNWLTWLLETSKRDQLSVGHLIDKETMMATLENEDLSPKDTISRLLDSAGRLRYPNLSRMKKDFDAAGRKLTAKTRWKMVKEDFFETDDVLLIARISGPEDVEKAWRELDAIHKDTALSTLWDSFSSGEKTGKS